MPARYAQPSRPGTVSETIDHWRPKPDGYLHMPTQRIASLKQPLPVGVANLMQRLIPPEMAPPQLFAAFARNEGLFAFLVNAGVIGPTGLLDRRALPRELRECVILRTCVVTGNDYEFNLHVQTISSRMGLTPAQIDDIRRSEPDAALWPGSAFVAMKLVDALVRRLSVADELFAECREHFDEATLIEITQLVGLYVGVAMQVALIRPEFDAYTSSEPIRTRLD